MKRLAPAFLFFGLLMATPAAADAIYDLYAQGHYQEAVQAGTAAGDGAGYALAARAALADAVLRPAPCLSCLRRAEALAQQAVSADPGDAYGHVWLAASLGYETRITGIIAARLSDTPDRARSALETALKDDAQNPYAVSAMGGWNIEVVRGGGAFLARRLYGATAGQALVLFDRAVRIAPGNVAVRYQIALALAGFDPETYRGRIGEELDAALRATAATAYERAMQARAGELKAALPGNRFSFDTLVRKFQGYP